MDYDTLVYAADAGVVRVTLARPDRRNSLCAQMKSDLTHALRRAPHDGRAVLLTGQGEAFCAGETLGDAANLRDLDLGRTQREETLPLLEALRDAEVPVVAAVNGAAAGAGMALALAADIAVAAENAVFSVPAARLGLAPDAGLTWWLPRLVGPARAMGLALLAEPLPARRAADWGLIWAAVPDADLPATAETLARRLAEGPAAAFRAARTLLREGACADWPAQLEAEAQSRADLGRSLDFLEGAVANAEARAPRFRGR